MWCFFSIFFFFYLLFFFYLDAFDHRATHFTYDGEVLPILLEGSLVYRPTLDFLNNIVVILGTEIMGYADVGIVEPKLYNPTETSLALDRVVGCDNNMNRY